MRLAARVWWHIRARACQWRADAARRQWLDLFDREIRLRARVEEFFRRRDGS